MTLEDIAKQMKQSAHSIPKGEDYEFDKPRGEKAAEVLLPHLIKMLKDSGLSNSEISATIREVVSGLRTVRRNILTNGNFTISP